LLLKGLATATVAAAKTMRAIESRTTSIFILQHRCGLYFATGAVAGCYQKARDLAAFAHCGTSRVLRSTLD